MDATHPPRLGTQGLDNKMIEYPQQTANTEKSERLNMTSAIRAERIPGVDADGRMAWQICTARLGRCCELFIFGQSEAHAVREFRRDILARAVADEGSLMAYGVK